MLAPLRRMFIALLAAFLGAGLLAPGATADAQDALTPPQYEAIERAVRDIMRANPEMVLEALEELERRRQRAEQSRVRDAIAAEVKALRHSPDSPVAGNPDGDVTVVEFFDYRCGYCKQVDPTVRELLHQDRGVRLVLKEFPILGPESILAARAALAAREQGAYLPMHRALMAAKGGFSEASLLQTAAELGLDRERLARDMASAKVEAEIRANYELAETLGITGTPAFVIGDELVPGAMPLDHMRQLVQAAREACETC